MSTVYSRRDSGLIVAEKSADFDAVERALKDFDRDLVLNVEYDHQGRARYEVHKIVSRDRPAVPVCVYVDRDGNPLPLSSGLVERVKQLHPDARRHRDGLDTDQWAERENKRLKERRKADFDDVTREIAADMGPRVAGKKSPVFHRGPHLRRTRTGGTA